MNLGESVLLHRVSRDPGGDFTWQAQLRPQHSVAVSQSPYLTTPYPLTAADMSELASHLAATRRRDAR